MSTFSDEFIDAEIERLEVEVAQARKAYDAAVADAIEKQDAGEARRYYLPYSDPLYSELRRIQNALADWKWQKQKREQTRFIKRVTTFPEEIQLSYRDLAFIELSERLGDFARLMQKDGLSTTAILKDIKHAINHPETNWTDELIAEQMKS